MKCCFWLSCCFSLLINTAIAKDLDRVYAIVNDDVITKNEYDQEHKSTLLELKARGRELPSDAVLKKQILDQMITSRLQLQIADRAGINVLQSQVQAAVQGIAQRNNLTIDELKAAISKDGIDYDVFRKRLEDQIRIQQVIERQVNSRVDISDQEVDEFLRSESLGTGLNTELNVSHIIVPISRSDEQNPEAGYALAKQKIEKAQGELQNGADFGYIATKYSSYNDAIEGGLIGWHKSGELPSLYYQALRSMSVDEISDVLQSENAFHLVKLNDQRSSQKPSDQMMSQVRLRQIFLEFNQNASPEYLRLRIKEIANKLDSGESFSELAKVYSEDPASMIKGGDMGWINPGDLGANIENIVFRLPLGQVSEPIQVGNGISLYEVTEKREHEAGDLFEKNAAREQIHSRKAEQLYQDWVQELRDRAYVQFLVDDLG